MAEAEQTVYVIFKFQGETVFTVKAAESWTLFDLRMAAVPSM